MKKEKNYSTERESWQKNTTSHQLILVDSSSDVEKPTPSAETQVQDFTHQLISVGSSNKVASCVELLQILFFIFDIKW